MWKRKIVWSTAKKNKEIIKQTSWRLPESTILKLNLLATYQWKYVAEIVEELIERAYKNNTKLPDIWDMDKKNVS